MRRSSRVAGVVLTLVLGGARAFAAETVDGRAVFEIRCAPCHGSSGGGDGPAAAALEPKPRNFRDPGFWRGRTRTSLRLTVEQGRPGTMMSPFKGVLSDAEIDGVVRYVESFRPAQ
jgi:mono/diheme cytochrome c family protein